MATRFEAVYDSFLNKVNDPDFLLVPVTTRENMLLGYLNSAQSEFQRLCKNDLSVRDGIYMEYSSDLTIEEINILALGMVYAWYDYRLNFSDKLSNMLSTKDYSLAAAPSNMLRELRATRDSAYAAFRRAMVIYSYAYGGLENLKP